MLCQVGYRHKGYEIARIIDVWTAFRVLRGMQRYRALHPAMRPVIDNRVSLSLVPYMLSILLFKESRIDWVASPSNPSLTTNASL